AFRKAAGANEHMNSSASPRQKHRGLTSGVGTTDDDDLVAVAKLRFLHEGRVVVDADAFEPPEIREGRLTVSSSCRNDHGASRNRRAVVQSHAVGPSFAGQLGG